MEENLNPGTMPTGGQETGSEVQQPERSYTKSQINEMMHKRIEKSHKAFFNRYGVKDLAELDELFGQAGSYGPLKQQFDELTKSNGELQTAHDELNNQIKDLRKRYAYKVGNVNPEKTSDIETYFKGKNLEIDENTLAEELKTHPEWVTKVSSIQPLGAEAVPTPTLDERELARKYFNVNLKRS